MNNLKTTAGVEMFAMEIGNRTRWVAGKAFSGGPVPGISDMNFGIMPDEFREAVKDATYAVYSYETPIVVEVDGVWLVPDVSYGNTTARHRRKITDALELLGIEWQKIQSRD